VALPPLKKHVVDGKLVDTFRGSLYGNDRNRSLPVAKRRLTIELFGHDRDTTLWGNRKRRNFSDLENNHGNHCTSGGSSCGGVSRLSDPSWELLKGASNDDFSIAKGDWQSDTDSSANDCDSIDNSSYQLAERDIVVLRVMKSRVVTQYDDEFGLGDNSISSALRDRKWESQSMSDRTMSWMVGLDTEDGDDNASFSSGESLTKKHMRWTELSRTRLSHIELVREDFDANEVDLKMGVGARTVVQTFRFDQMNAYSTMNNKNEGNARTFSRLFRILKRLEKERAQRLTAAHRSLLSERDSFNHGLFDESSHGNTRSHRSDKIGKNLGNGICDSSNDCKGEKSETNETVSILVEIVSANNLPSSRAKWSERHDGINPHYTLVAEGRDSSIADPEVAPSIDPYVVIRDGTLDIHSTAYIPDAINPVWTVSMGSLFLLQSDLVEFFDSSNVLEFTVKNHSDIDDIEHQPIGTVMVHKTELLNGTGERKCYQILQPPMVSQVKGATLEPVDSAVEAPYLCLRYRQASAEDIDFMETFRKGTNQKYDQPKEEGVYASKTFLAPQSKSMTLVDPSLEKPAGENGKSSMILVNTTTIPSDKPPGTERVTKIQIEDFSKEHSTSWTEAGSGSIGKLYIEIMACDGLSKANRAIEMKTSTFVNLIFEDSIVNTEVVHDCSSPRWMPWSQRAFVLNMIHLSSQVFVGVFDYINDEENGDLNHNPLGRAVINISNLRPRAIHTLTYNLYDSDDVNREFRGTVTMRLRIAIHDERRALISELYIRDHYSISTMKESDFQCASYSILENNQSHAMSLESLTDHVDELLGYVEITDQIVDALLVVLLWKGNYSITLNLDTSAFRTSRRREIVLDLPIHSIVAFAWATILAWNLEHCISFLCFFVGWVFLAVLESQRRHPSPWRRPRSYAEHLNILLFHKSKFAALGRPPLRRTIHPNERLGEMEIFEFQKAEQRAARQKRLGISSSEREQYQKSPEEEERTTQQEVSSDGNNSQTSCRSNDSSSSRVMEELGSSNTIPDPSKVILFSIQNFFCKSCRLLRVCSSVILWRDSYLAFWITSLCFATSFVAFWIPWLWLIQWSFRLFVWPFFWPWMKLVDIFYFQERKNLCTNGENILPLSDTEILVDLLDRMMERTEANAILRENTLKYKDMKRYMFGKYSTRIPIFQEERFPFEPAVSSSSVPYNTNPRPVQITSRIHGQLLKGDMVPSRNYNTNPGQEDM